MKQVTEAELLERPFPILETAASGSAVAIVREDGADVAIVSKADYDEFAEFRRLKLKGEFDLIFEKYGDAFRALADR